MKTRLTTSATLALAAAMLPGGASAQMPVAKVVVVEARLMETQATVTLVGSVRPVRRSRVSAEIAGLVEEMPAREGDFIPAGGIICKLKDQGVALRLDAETAKLESLKATHEELVNGTRKQELRRLKAVRDAAVAEYDRWKFEMDRIERLHATNDSNEKEYNDTRSEYVAAERRKVATDAAYELGVEGPRKEAVAQAAYDVAEQQAVVRQAMRDVEKTVARPPFAGHVIERTVEIGEWVVQGGSIVEMVDLSSVLVRVDVPETSFPHLRVGEPVRVKIDALQRSFDGRIKHIMPQADPNARTFPVDIEIDNAEGVLAGGMFARATLPAGRLQRSVAVPKDAIVQREGINYVGVIVPSREGGAAGMTVPVTLGSVTDGWIAITSGNLQAGTRVVTRGTENIMPFPSPVVIVDERGTPVATPSAPGEKNGSDGD